jgi:hypothetical protein
VTTRRDPDLPENRSDKFSGTEWTGGNTINLVAGRRYYTELLYKEGGGGDNGAVAMVKAGSPDPGNGSPAVGGNLVGAEVDPGQGRPALATLQGATVAPGGTATLTANAIGTPPITYQWRFRPLLSAQTADVAGATAATLEIRNAAAANSGLYTVVAKNEEGEATSNLAMLALEGTLFIEAEDFNFDQGQYDKTNPIGLTGPYPGGTYLNKGDGADGAPGAGIDLGIDYNEAVVSNDPGAVPAYRVGTGVEAAKPNAHADGLPRGSFDVSNNYVVGWNDPGDWYNYTRAFPEPAKSYNVIGRLSSGGNPIIAELGDVTGATTANQTVTKLGNFKPGRATAGWDNMEWFQMTDDAGNAASVSLGGEKTLRFTTLPGANLDVDYFMLVPAGGGPGPGPSLTITLAGGQVSITYTGTLQGSDTVTGPYTDVAGATSPYSTAPSGTARFFRSRQ